MKNWICYNLFGEHPDDVDAYGMVLGLGIQGFLVFWAVYFFIYIPFFVAGWNTMTIQVQHTLNRLIAIHGYSAMFVSHMGEGISLYSVGGYHYRIRGDGTIL